MGLRRPYQRPGNCPQAFSRSTRTRHPTTVRTGSILPMFATLLLQIAPLNPVVPAEVYPRFHGFDHDGDGQVEIESLSPIALPDQNAAPNKEDLRRVLILVEGRLLQPLEGSIDLHPQLAQLRDDLVAEGYAPCAMAVDLAPSDAHQDGRYVLALREVLRAFDGDKRLAGALLIGHFPDAYLVRTCNWRRKGDIRLGPKGSAGRVHKDVHYVRRVPEHVSQRADIVLADLDGAWEDLYVQPKVRLQRTIAVFDGAIPTAGGACVDIEVDHLPFEDCFHISDGKLEVQELVAEADASPAEFRVFLDDRSADHECSPGDRQRTNIIARPDVYVSRIDAWGSARSPREDVKGEQGEGLLDADGQPQTVTWVDGAKVPDWRRSIWRPDAQLERQLIAEFLTRNHAFRTGTAKTAWRASSIAADLGSGYRSIEKAATNWAPDDSGLQDVTGKPTLARFVQWMQHPAVLRTVRAHSNATHSVFGGGDLQELEALAGKTAWSWTPRGQQLVPSLEAACKNGRLDWFLMRTLWKNGSVAREPSIYLHTGCEAVSPPNSRHQSFTAPSYGAMQGAEALLLMGNGLALVGRAKVFYDEPKGFAETLRDGGTVGAAWAKYYDVESNAPTWDQAGGDIGRKRSYFWSVLGDWTIRLSMAAPPR